MVGIPRNTRFLSQSGRSFATTKNLRVFLGKFHSKRLIPNMWAGDCLNH